MQIQPISNNLTYKPVSPVKAVSLVNSQQRTEEIKPKETQNESKGGIYDYPKSSIYDMPSNKLNYMNFAGSSLNLLNQPAQNMRPEIVPPEPLKPTSEIQHIVNDLTNPDYNVQANSMSSLAELSKNAPEIAKEFVTNSIMNSLLNIIGLDTSKVEPQNQQLAVRNKSFAIKTAAYMQKCYIDDIKAKTNSTVPLVELPVAAGIIEEFKTTTNPKIKLVTLQALNYIRQPEYNNEMKTLFREATTDANLHVRNCASNYLCSIIEEEGGSTPMEQMAMAS